MDAAAHMGALLRDPARDRSIAELTALQVFCLTPGTATNDLSTLHFRYLEDDYYVKPRSIIKRAANH